MDDEKAQWLRSLYQEVPEGCPATKCIKVSDIHKQIEERYAMCSHNKVSELLHKAFPNAETKIATKSRTMHVFGIEPVSEASSSQHTITEMAALLESERTENRDLRRKTRVLEARIQELERTSAGSPAQQADALPHTSLTAYGPDSYEHFHGFSIDGVICELKEQVPDIYTFITQLADVQRNVGPDEASRTLELQAVTVLCTLLNARSSRVKDIQLLLSMMLIARSISKQVGEKSEYLYIYTCVHTYKQIPLGPDSPRPCWSLHVLSNDVELPATTDNTISVC